VNAAAHPRALTIAQRELIVRNGLGDREQSVKGAAENLLGIWADVLSNKEDNKIKPGQENANVVEEDVLALLRMFDLAEAKVAEEALLSVFTTRADVLDSLKFGGSFTRFMSSKGH